jgi:hypothetical protein
MRRNEERPLPPGHTPREMIADGHARIAQVREIVEHLQRYRASRAVGTAEHAAACAATLQAEMTLRRMENAVRVLEEAEASQASTEFALDWIVLHGIPRGMPPGWRD